MWTLWFMFYIWQEQMFVFKDLLLKSRFEKKKKNRIRKIKGEKNNGQNSETMFVQGITCVQYVPCQRLTTKRGKVSE